MSECPIVNAEFQCDEACRLERVGDVAGAESAYRLGISLDAKHYRTRFLYSHLLVGQGRLDEAAGEAYAAYCLDRNPSARCHVVEVLTQQAYSLANRSDLADIDFDRMAEISETLVEMGAGEAAETLLRFPLELGVCCWAVMVLVRMLVQAGRQDEALAIVGQLELNESSQAWSIYAQGFAAWAAGDTLLAMDRFLSGIAGGVNGAHAHRFLLTAADEIRNQDDRIAAYRKIEQHLGADNLHVMSRLAWVCHIAADHVEAGRLCKALSDAGHERFAELDMPLQQSDKPLTYAAPESRASLSARTADHPMRRLLETPEKIKKVVCINFWGRSGSFLLSSLFDGHPQILQILHPHSMLDVWSQILTRFQYMSSIENLVNRIVECFARYSFGEKFDSLRASLPEEAAGEFAETLLCGCQKLAARGYLNPAMVFRVVHIAYAFATKQKVDEDCIIVFQSHNGGSDTRVLFDRLVPGADFIACVRFPERSYDSHLFHHYYETPLGAPFSLSKLLFGMLLDMGENLPEHERSERSVVVRFEDLHHATRPVMEALAHRLGVRWDDCLLASTVGGKPWGMPSQRAGGGVNHGTRRLTVKDFRTAVMTWYDRRIVRCVLRENYLEWGYARSEHELPSRVGMSLLLWLPSKIDTIVFIDHIKIIGLRAACRQFFETYRAMRRLMLDERARRDRQAPHLMKLAYSLELIPDDVRYPPKGVM